MKSKTHNNPMQSNSTQSLLKMHQSKRCLAKTRKAIACQSPAMPNGKCRMHGGCSTGAPKGNKNALKHGRFTAQNLKEMQYFRELVKESIRLVDRT